MILSAAMLLDHIGEHAAGEAVRGAVRDVFSERSVRTRDLGGTSTTGQMTEAIVAAVRLRSRAA